jgi:hypothetical protein
MGWEQRGKRRYYYRSHWENGRTVKEYFGSGEVAEAVAEYDARMAALRDCDRAERLHTQIELARLDAELEHIDQLARAALHAAMTAAGFHWHRGAWRKKTMSTPTTNDPKKTEELLARAHAGDREAYNQVRPLLAQRQAIEAFGNVSQRSLGVAVNDFSGKDLVTLDAVFRKLDALREELAGPNPTPMERLLVDRVVTMWFHLHKLECSQALATSPHAPGSPDFERAINSAHKRYLTAIRELTTFRRNLRPEDQPPVPEAPPAPAPAPAPREAPMG